MAIVRIRITCGNHRTYHVEAEAANAALRAMGLDRYNTGHYERDSESRTAAYAAAEAEINKLPVHVADTLDISEIYASGSQRKKS